jgi:hypothetical protein
MYDQSFVEDKSKLINKKLNFQRWFYSIIGLIIISIIILLTFGQIRYIKKYNYEFAIYILFIVHSSLLLFIKNKILISLVFRLVYVLISLLTTAIFCRMLYKILIQIILGLFFYRNY